jgi:hypothetical protein
MGRGRLRLKRVIAASDHLHIARVVFAEAGRLMPAIQLYLRHRARVIEKYEPQAGR